MIDSDSVVWCIELNKVGTKKIPDLPDGDYKVYQPTFYNNKIYKLNNKINIEDGKVDVDSCKTAVAEFMNKSGRHDHRFIESIFMGEQPNSISFFLGS